MTTAIRILITVLSFVAGAIAILLWGNRINWLIIDCYQWSTDHHFRFTGKYFHFPSWDLMLIAGLTGAIDTWCLSQKSFRVIAAGIISSCSLLSLAFVSMVYFSAWGKLIVCTACNDGMLTMSVNAIAYDQIVGYSLALSLIPTIFIHIIHRRKNKSAKPSSDEVSGTNSSRIHRQSS